MSVAPRRRAPGRTGEGPTAWVIDCETTGLSADDRIVTLGAVELVGPRLTGRTLHLVFDPQRPSNPFAERVHGWSRAMLEGQPLFRAHAGEISGLLSGGDRIVAHNAAFDLRFVAHEFALAGLPRLTVPSYCTMLGWKEIRGGRGGLDVCIASLGLAPRGGRHNAFEDALLAAQVYARLVFGTTLEGAVPDLAEPVNRVR
ncbi:3'-5' exonuclease [Segnochrobactraceae bacterium EtOH-i3]